MTADLFVAAASALGVAGSVAAAFWKYEDVASPEAKQTVASWLKYRGSDSTSPKWADHLVTAFNRIFGQRHLSLSCFLRSCLASLIAFSVLFLVWSILRPGEFSNFYSGRSLGDMMWLLVGVAILNGIPDYISYMKSRIILATMSRSERLSRMWQLAAIDALLTVAIFLVLLLVSSFVLDILDNIFGPFDFVVHSRRME
jgi:hypothetical protein